MPSALLRLTEKSVLLNRLELAHGNRGGRRPRKVVPGAAAGALVGLASNGYSGANYAHLTELLWERESIDMSRSTVRRVLA